MPRFYGLLQRKLSFPSNWHCEPDVLLVPAPELGRVKEFAT